MDSITLPAAQFTEISEELAAKVARYTAAFHGEWIPLENGCFEVICPASYVDFLVSVFTVHQVYALSFSTTENDRTMGHVMVADLPALKAAAETIEASRNHVACATHNGTVSNLAPRPTPAK